MTDRGVSEVLGYVLVFALVTGIIGVVFATGFSGLGGAQHEEQVQNIERAFDVLADNIDDLSGGDAPSRATEVKLAGGSISTGEAVTVLVEAENTSDSADNVSHSVQVEPIVYEDGDGTSIVYTTGAVLRAESSGAVMLRDPRWVVRPDRSVLPLLNTGGSGGGAAGDGAVLVVAQRQSRSLGDPLVAEGGATVRVNVTVTSTRAEAWKRYFEAQGFNAFDGDATDDDVTYSFETDALYVPRSSVEVTFDR